MSWLSRWLHQILDKPQPPISPPKPVLPAPPILPPVPPVVLPGPSLDDVTTRALAALNTRRVQRGVGLLILDPGLCAAAMELAVPLGKGQAEPHQDFPGRVRRNGWSYQDMGVLSGFGNTSEGISWGGRTPEEAILILDSSPDPKEGHRRDFEDEHFDFVGIAIVPNGPLMLRVAQVVMLPHPDSPMTLASAVTAGPDGQVIVPVHLVVAAAALGGGYTSIGGLACIVDYGSRRRV